MEGLLFYFILFCDQGLIRGLGYRDQGKEARGFIRDRGER